MSFDRGQKRNMGKFVCREFLYYSYANLETAHYAVKCRDGKYKKTAYMIRTKRDYWMEL